MFNDAFAQIASAFSLSYGGPFHDAFAIHPGNPVFDDGGSIIVAGTETRKRCKVQVDSVTDAMRNEANYQDKDVRLFVLRSSLDGGLDADHTISIIEGPHTGDWMIASINQDPAAIGWECRGRQL